MPDLSSKVSCGCCTVLEITGHAETSKQSRDCQGAVRLAFRTHLFWFRLCRVTEREIGQLIREHYHYTNLIQIIVSR